MLPSVLPFVRHNPCEHSRINIIGFQILLRTKYVPSFVKILWRMLILECSQGCYTVKNLPSDLDLRPMTLKINREQVRHRSVFTLVISSPTKLRGDIVMLPSVLPSVRHNPCEHSRISILQWILTKLGTYLVLRRIWNPIDFRPYLEKLI
jgi:hypothetical protein